MEKEKEKEINIKTNKKNKVKNISMFKRMFSFLSLKDSNILLNTTVDTSDELSESDKTISLFLTNCLNLKMYDDIFKIRASGFNFSNTQEKKFLYLAIEEFNNQNYYNFFLKMENYNISLPSYFFIDRLLEINWLTKSETINEKTKLYEPSQVPTNILRNLVVKALNEPENQLKLRNKWTEKFQSLLVNSNYLETLKLDMALLNGKHALIIESSQDVNSKFFELMTEVVLPLIKYPKFLLDTKDLQEVMLIASKFQELKKIFEIAMYPSEGDIGQFINYHIKKSNQSYKNKDFFTLFNIIEKKLSAYLSSDIFLKEKEKIYNSIVVSTENLLLEDKPNPLEFKNLPEESKKIMKEIEIVYKELLRENLSDVEKYELKRIWEKSIKDTIVDYLKLSPRYLETMVNSSGKNVNKILEETLTQYLNIFENKLKEINQEHFSKISVNHRYATSKNNGI